MARPGAAVGRADEDQTREEEEAVNLLHWVSLAAALSLAQSTDAGLLRELHEKVMRAHRLSDVELLLKDESADYVVANRGEISRPTLQERRERLGPYLRSTVFEEYRDLTDPVVKVSGDGTLGWVIVQVEARGSQTNAEGGKTPLEFVSAWIELYEKRDGRWLRVGNVSNFKP
ncbi:MAG: hypothetical protein ACREAA_11330 [Candidatus Polarisedimenticolia bacterium]